MKINWDTIAAGLAVLALGGPFTSIAQGTCGMALPPALSTAAQLKSAKTLEQRTALGEFLSAAASTIKANPAADHAACLSDIDAAVSQLATNHHIWDGDYDRTATTAALVKTRLEQPKVASGATPAAPLAATIGGLSSLLTTMNYKVAQGHACVHAPLPPPLSEGDRQSLEAIDTQAAGLITFLEGAAKHAKDAAKEAAEQAEDEDVQKKNLTACVRQIEAAAKRAENQTLWVNHASELKRALNKSGEALTKFVKAGGNTSPEAMTAAQTGLDRALAGLTAYLNARSPDAAEYGLYAGVQYRLTPSGEWTSSAEAQYLAIGEPAKNVRICSLVPRGFFSARFSDREEGEATAQGNATNPFESGGGVLSLKSGVSLLPSKGWLGLSFRVGLESLPTDAVMMAGDGMEAADPGMDGAGMGGAGMGDEAADPATQSADRFSLIDLEPNVSVGLTTFTRYPNGALGSMFMGVEYDNRWRRMYTGEPNAFERVALQGILQLPVFKGSAFRLATAFEASAPLNGNGSSEVSASLLLFYELQSFLPFLSKDEAGADTDG